MTSADAERFRQQAEDSRQQANKAISPHAKEAWLRLADELAKLAQVAQDMSRRKMAPPH